MSLVSRACLPLLALTLLLPACGAPPAFRSPFPVLPKRPQQADVLDYDISVDVDHLAGTIVGHVDILLAALPGEPTAAITLDAVEMDVAGVWDDQGRPLAFRNDGLTLDVAFVEPLAPGARAVVGIDYRCAPRRGMYFVGPSAADPLTSWHVWTQGQTEDTRHWFPCQDRLDDLATHTLRATVDGAFRTMAAGALQHSTLNPATGRRTDTWRMDVPHAVSLVTLVAGTLAHGELQGGPVPLPVVAEPGSLEHALANFAVTGPSLAYIADYVGRPYPFPKYAQCCVKEFRAGGMENVSSTTLVHEAIHDPAADPQVDQADLVVHEAAHQWFGDLIGARDWGEIWLNEGFATYFEALWYGHADGQDAMDRWMLAMQRRSVQAELDESRPIVWHDWTDPEQMFDEHAYPAAGCRLHLLSEMLGPDVFRAGVRRYVADNASRIVVTDDLRTAMEAVSGRDLSTFFDEWLHGAGFPEFVVDVAPSADGTPVLRAEQVQSARGWREVFHLPVQVAWSRGGHERSARLEVDAKVESMVLTGNGELDWVRFDAATSTPGTVDLGQPEAAWARQLASAQGGVTRLLAAEWFAGSPHVRRRGPSPEEPSPEALAALRRAAASDPWPPVRAAALEALGVVAEADDADTLAVVQAALADADARVRAAAAADLAVLGDDAVLPALVEATGDGNDSVAAAALTALAVRGYPGLLGLCREVAARTDAWRLDGAVVRTVATLPDDRDAVPFLLAAARREPVPRVRAAALEALSGRDDPHGTIFRTLVAGLHDESFLVRIASARALGGRDDEAARRQLRARQEVEADAFVLRTLGDALR